MIRILATILLALHANSASADVVRLESGGEIRGELVRDGDLPRSIVAVDSA